MIEEAEVEERSHAIFINSSDNLMRSAQWASKRNTWKPRGVEEHNGVQATVGSGFDAPATDSASTGSQTVSTNDQKD